MPLWWYSGVPYQMRLRGAVPLLERQVVMSFRQQLLGAMTRVATDLGREDLIPVVREVAEEDEDEEGDGAEGEDGEDGEEGDEG